MIIDFDPTKSGRNIRERGLSFDRVGDFDFTAAIVREDIGQAYPERRFVALGFIDTRLHVLCFTPVDGGIRVISFREGQSPRGTCI